MKNEKNNKKNTERIKQFKFKAIKIKINETPIKRKTNKSTNKHPTETNKTRGTTNKHEQRKNKNGTRIKRVPKHKRKQTQTKRIKTITERRSNSLKQTFGNGLKHQQKTSKRNKRTRPNNKKRNT